MKKTGRFLVILTMAGSIFLGQKIACADEGPLFVCIVREFKGEIFVKRPGYEWCRVRNGMLLNEGSFIRTMDQSKLLLEIVRSNRKALLFTVNENTEATLSKLHIDNSGFEYIGFEIENGSVTSPLRDFRDETELSVKTPNGLIKGTRMGFIIREFSEEGSR